MITEKFKGDELELQFEAAGSLATNACSSSLDDFFNGCYSAGDFLLMLYDEGRMPFTSRVPRDSFVAFIQQAIPNFPFTGTFEAYLLTIQAVFGQGSGVLFDVTGPGKLEIMVNAAAEIEFDWVAIELLDGVYTESNVVDHSDDQIVFSAIAGVDNESKLKQLLSELIPAGIFPDVIFQSFTISDFIADYDGNEFNVVDHLGNQIVFFEIGD